MRIEFARRARVVSAFFAIVASISCSNTKMAGAPGQESPIAEGDYTSLYAPKEAGTKAAEYDLAISFRDTTVTLDCSRAPLRAILDSFIVHSDIDIVPPPQINERVSLKLKDRGIREALTTILDLNDYQLVTLPTGVCSIEIETDGGSISKEYRFDHLAAASIMGAISNSTGPGVTLEFTPIFERNSILVTGDGEAVGRYIKTLRDMDVPEPLILLEVVIVEFDMLRFESYGFDFSSIAKHRLQLSYSPANYHSVGKQVAGAESALPGDLSNLTFFANLEALVQDNTATIVSHPHILATSGKEATFSVSEDRYFKQQGFDLGDGVGEVDKMSADIHLTMTPYLTGSGDIIIDLDMGANSFVSPPADPDQIVQGNNLTSFLKVKDNDVLVAGGMITKSRERDNAGIPFLRKIPLVKLLFSEGQNSASRNEIVCFIIPHIYDHRYKGEGTETAIRPIR